VQHHKRSVNGLWVAQERRAEGWEKQNIAYEKEGTL